MLEGYFQRVCIGSCRKASKLLYKKRYLLLLILLIAILLPTFFGLIKMVVILIIFSFMNMALSIFSRRLPQISTSLELIMFSTVLAATAYGAKVGAAFGLIQTFLYYYGTGRFSFYIVIFAPLYAIIGSVVPLFSSYPIAVVGITATVIYAIISSVLTIVLFSANVHKAVMFGIVNTFFNFVLFQYFAPILIRIM